MSFGDAWKQAFNDSVGEVHPQYKTRCENIEARNAFFFFSNLNLCNEDRRNQGLGTRASLASGLEVRLGSRQKLDASHADRQRTS